MLIFWFKELIRTFVGCILSIICIAMILIVPILEWAFNDEPYLKELKNVWKMFLDILPIYSTVSRYKEFKKKPRRYR